MIKKIIKKIDIFYYSIILFILDYILHLVFKTVDYNLSHILFFDLALGTLLSFLLYVSKGIIKNIIYIVVNIIVLLYSFLVVIEIFVKINYDSSYPIKTIISNISNVLSQYSDEILDLAKNHILILFVFILFIVLYFVLSKIIFLDKEYSIKLPNIIIYLSLMLVSAVITLFTVNKHINNWSDNLVYNGLKTAIINDLMIDNSNNFDFINTNIETNMTTKDSIDDIENITKDIDIKNDDN